jgi:tetratricopeptide (TPR) repeat protein
MAVAPKESPPTSRVAAPEQWLQKAMSAKTPAARARFAQKGLSTRGPLDKTTQTMLLRQLYLSLFETRKFERAQLVAEEAIALGVLVDVMHQDAARASLASGSLGPAIVHLRAATRRAPASRRAFHYWTLGSVLFLDQRYDESIAALERASRWGTTDKPLYRAHLALVRIASGGRVQDLQGTIDDLAEAPCGQGYGRFVLGHLAYAAREWEVARKYLGAFVKRTEASRTLMSIALEGEVAMAKATLAKMAEN